MSEFLDAFEIVGLAGEGAMAQVWHAVHRELRTPVALKVITARFANDANFRTRFAREIRLVSRLNIRGIIRLYDHGQMSDQPAHNPSFRFEPGTPYCLMEWIPDGTLHDRVGNMQWTELRATLLCLLEALAAAHSNRIIHRDLKPRNILMSGRGPVISDFGIAYGQDHNQIDDDSHAFVAHPTTCLPSKYEEIGGVWPVDGSVCSRLPDLYSFVRASSIPRKVFR